MRLCPFLTACVHQPTGLSAPDTTATAAAAAATAFAEPEEVPPASAYQTADRPSAGEHFRAPATLCRSHYKTINEVAATVSRRHPQNIERVMARPWTDSYRAGRYGCNLDLHNMLHFFFNFALNFR